MSQTLVASHRVSCVKAALGLRNWRETKRFTDALCSKVRATGKREADAVVTNNYRHGLLVSGMSRNQLNVTQEDTACK
jgi:DUF2075 family protein